MPSSPSKPVSRIHSRPLSTTTTATITPSTPKQRNTPPAYDSSQSTPKPSATRQKLQDLFRIPLGRKSRSRSRSRSRPSTPNQLLPIDIPPLPTPDDTTPRHRKPSSPHRRPISPPRSPSPTPRPLRVTNATPSLASTATSLKIPKFLSCKLEE